mgnify:CR=1 FL=1
MRETWLDRRGLLIRGSGGLAATLALAVLPGEAQAASPKLGADPFTPGVAAGHPLADGIVLWTRLAPRPPESSADGMPPVAMPVERLDLAVATCDDWSSGLDTPYQDMIRHDLDLVLHRGDDIDE